MRQSGDSFHHISIVKLWHSKIYLIESGETLTYLQIQLIYDFNSMSFWSVSKECIVRLSENIQALVGRGLTTETQKQNVETAASC